MPSFTVRMLIVLFIAYVLQSVFSYIQIKKTYEVVSAVRKEHAGEDVSLVTGSGRTGLILIKRGYFILLCVNNADDTIADFWEMSGFTNFSRPQQFPEYIGMTLDEAEASFTVKNEKKAFVAAREQLEVLRKYATHEEARDSENETETDEKGDEEQQ